MKGGKGGVQKGTKKKGKKKNKIDQNVCFK